jgi:hypothetical protein
VCRKIEIEIEIGTRKSDFFHCFSKKQYQALLQKASKIVSLNKYFLMSFTELLLRFHNITVVVCATK